MATYYAQAAGAIQSVEWDTAPTGGGTDLTWPPAADDVLCANGKAITWAAASVPTLTCARLSTTGEGTGTPGGGFTLSGSTAVAITADIVAGTTTCLTSTHTGTGVNAVTIWGDPTGGTVAHARGVYKGSGVGGAILVSGTVTAGSGIRAHGVCIDAAPAATIIGSLVDTETAQAAAGAIFWQPVAGVHYHKVFYDAGTPKYYGPPPAQTDVRDGIPAGFSDLGVAYNGTVVIPSAGDVRLGVDFDYPGKETGTLKLPAEADVRDGVLYGGGGTEFEGEYTGGGGVPLVGPGGLVG